MPGPDVVDAHAHVWDPRVLPVDWIRGTPFDGPRLPAMIEPSEVTHRIFVEADARATPEAEVAWVESLGWPGLVAVVADVELDGERLSAHLAALTGRPLVRGVRHLLQDVPAERVAGPELTGGLRRLGAAGLTFDACVRWQQLPALRELLAGAPDTGVVLDHCGKPPVDAGLHSVAGRAWHDAVRRVAELGHVAVKLSGLRAEATDAARFREHAPAFVAATLEAFGPERSMFATDWPVSTGPAAGVPVPDWLATVREAAGAAWPRGAAGTARAWYRLA